jgi:hypothetical protein
MPSISRNSRFLLAHREDNSAFRALSSHCIPNAHCSAPPTLGLCGKERFTYELARPDPTARQVSVIFYTVWCLVRPDWVSEPAVYASSSRGFSETQPHPVIVETEQ